MIRRPAHRRQGWEMRLEVAVADAAKEEFRLGHFDCFLFAARCVLASTGVDVAAEFRKGYDSKGRALALIAERGGFVAGLTDLFGAVGIMPCAVSMAQRGDVLLLPGSDGWPGTLAVCLGSTCAAPGPTGLCFTATLSASHAWHIEQAPLCRS